MKRRIRIAFDVESDGKIYIHDNRIQEFQVEYDQPKEKCKHVHGLHLMSTDGKMETSRLCCNDCGREINIDWKEFD